MQADELTQSRDPQIIFRQETHLHAIVGEKKMWWSVELVKEWDLVKSMEDISAFPFRSRLSSKYWGKNVGILTHTVSLD